MIDSFKIWLENEEPPLGMQVKWIGSPDGRVFFGRDGDEEHASIMARTMNKNGDIPPDFVRGWIMKTPVGIVINTEDDARNQKAVENSLHSMLAKRIIDKDTIVNTTKNNGTVEEIIGSIGPTEEDPEKVAQMQKDDEQRRGFNMAFDANRFTKSELSKLRRYDSPEYVYRYGESAQSDYPD